MEVVGGVETGAEEMMVATVVEAKAALNAERKVICLVNVPRAADEHALGVGKKVMCRVTVRTQESLECELASNAAMRVTSRETAPTLQKAEIDLATSVVRRGTCLASAQIHQNQAWGLYVLASSVEKKVTSHVIALRKRRQEEEAIVPALTAGRKDTSHGIVQTPKELGA